MVSEIQSYCPKITHLTLRAVLAPLNPPLRTANGEMSKAPLILVDIHTDADVDGHAYIFTYSPAVLPAVFRLISDVSTLVVGQALRPLGIMRELRHRFVLLGTPGLLDMVLAGLDMALWDAHARASGLSLARLLGGESKALKSYASFGMDGLRHGVESAEKSVDEGFTAVKIKIGYATLKEDLAVVQAVQQSLKGHAELMVDYNQSLTLSEALHRTRAMDDLGLAWIEEPLSCDDLQGHARLRQARETPIQLGENAWGPRGIADIIEQGASSFAMLDLMKVGGVSGWLEAATLCNINRMPVSNHFYQEASAHLLSVSPTSHYHEYFGVADAVLASPLKIENGFTKVSNAAGSGVEWNEEAVKRYQVSAK